MHGGMIFCCLTGEIIFVNVRDNISYSSYMKNIIEIFDMFAYRIFIEQVYNFFFRYTFMSLYYSMQSTMKGSLLLIIIPQENVFRPSPFVYVHQIECLRIEMPHLFLILRVSRITINIASCYIWANSC